MFFSKIKLLKVDMNRVTGVSSPVKHHIPKVFKIHLETCGVQQKFVQ